MQLWNQIVAWIPAVILQGILIFVYSIHFIFYLKDLDNTPFLVIFHIFAIIFYYTIIKLLIVVPGSVNQQAIEDTWKQWDEYLAMENQRNTEHVKARKSQRSQRMTIQNDPEDHSCVEYDDEELDDMDEGYKLQLKTQRKIELLDKPGRRFCKKCCIPKPARTHHCSQCRSCWQKMDHHCQWINNCVALNNYKLFFVMILYASILLVVVAINQYKIFLAAIQEEEVSDFKLFVIVLHYYFVVLLAVLISGFFIFHVFLTCQNKTTLEYLEDKPDVSHRQYLEKQLQYGTDQEFTIHLRKQPFYMAVTNMINYQDTKFTSHHHYYYYYYYYYCHFYCHLDLFHCYQCYWN